MSDDEAARRIGQAAAGGGYPLELGELAVLLVAAAHWPGLDLTARDGPGAFIARCWRELHAVSPSAAARAFEALRAEELDDPAPLVQIAQLLASVTPDDHEKGTIP